jgi:predicted O-methyltransferase YrrM
VPTLREAVSWKIRSSTQLQKLRRDVMVWRHGSLFPHGHFYSPTPDFDAVTQDKARIFDVDRSLHQVTMDTEAQVALAKEVVALASEDASWHGPGARYSFQNLFFNSADALMLVGMLRKLQPRRIIEVGSGFSSAAILDANDLFLGGALECTFIEPYPDRLNSLLRPAEKATVIASPVQSVDPAVFDTLEAGDILFIDSSHVSKVGSDVNYLLLDILPRLALGVWIHVHDIGYPFEYAEESVDHGRAWNEAYVLHAFMLFNTNFRIRLWNSYLHTRHRQEMAACSKDWVDGNGGGSIWIERTS